MLIKNNSTITLCISLYYSKSDWDLLSLKGIKPFVTDNNSINYYLIYFSEFRGEHIRLILSVGVNEAQSISQKVDLHFKEFFKTYPSVQKNIRKKKTPNFFMNFENNSIRYGIYSFPGINSISNENKYITKIANLILLIFEDFGNQLIEEFEEITIQMLIIFINTFKLKKNEIVFLMDKRISKYNVSFKTEEWYELLSINQGAFEANKKTLCLYLKDEINISIIKYSSQWENEWRKILLKTYPKKINVKDPKFYIYFEEVFNEISKALNNKNNLNIFYIFNESLKCYNKF